MSFYILQIFFFVAIAAEAMSAALAAGRRSMDWFGVAMLGSITALGGGSIRDVLLGHHPLTWVAHPHYLLITAGAALATIALARAMPHLKRLFLLLDAIGLVVFTIVGCNVALEMGQPLLIVIVAGMITGCLGGVMRDVLCNDIPLLFRSELYASVSIVTGIVYIVGRETALSHDAVVFLAMAVGLAMRLMALRYGWNMPKFVYMEEGGEEGR